MHNGQVGGWDRIRRRLEARLTDARYHERRGATDSEVLFLLLDANDLAADPIAAMRSMLAETRRAMIDAGVDEPLRLTAALSDGKHLHAFRYSSDDKPPSLYWRHGDDGITVVSEPIDAAHDQWTTVAPNTVLTVEPGGRVRLDSFEVELDRRIAARVA